VVRRRFVRSAAVAWLPVACLLAITLVAAPGSSAPRVSGSLTISPKVYYGGQALTFSGSTGRSGRQRIWLEFNQNRVGDEWMPIEGSNHMTDEYGRFSFRYPARGMMNISVRVASARTVTPGVLFQAEDQAVTVAVRPSDPHLYDARTCGAGFDEFLSYDVLAGEAFEVEVDSSPEGEPILAGRGVTLERRDGRTWTEVATGRLDGTGMADFPLTIRDSGPVAYRAVLDDVDDGANRIGWFPSFPTYVDVLGRAAAVSSAKAVVPPADPTLGGPNPEELQLSWALADSNASKILVGWNWDGSAVSDVAEADEVRTLGPSSTGFVATGLDPATSYSFTVVTPGGDGTCPTPVLVSGRTAAAPPPSPVTALLSLVRTTQVGLSWQPPATRVAEIRIRRSLGSTPPATVTSGRPVASLGATATSYTDGGLQLGTTYAYSVFTRSLWGDWSVATSTTVTTGGVLP
jgi:hypothetical protein